jgi:hypothetical protein
MTVIDYDSWASDIETGKVPADPAAATHAEEDPEAGLRLLLDATGATSYDEAVHVALGRPRLDAETSKSPVWRVRTTPALDQAIKARAKAEGRSVSELLRRAAADYLTHV